MELLLWRWSTAVQILSALMIAVFFAVLGRSVRRIELRPWVRAWLANLVALAVTVIFWFFQPTSTAEMVGLRFAYFFGKTMFVVLLVQGASSFVDRRAVVRQAQVILGVTIYSAVGAFGIDTIAGIGVAQSSLIALMFASAALILLTKSKAPGVEWLAFGFAARSALAAAEAVAYGSQIIVSHWSSSAAARIFLASHSSLDTGAEWVIALGCVLTLYGTIQQELTHSNADLLAAQEVLQQLADRDPLTGLANRRALPNILREVYLIGATILFFDLNDFKMVNDSYGHEAGDDCLKRFARALEESFRPGDHIIRYAGDEFLVIARGAEPQQITDRIRTLRDRLASERGRAPIRFSVGHSYLAVKGDPEEAIRAADEAMYRDKPAKGRRFRAV